MGLFLAIAGRILRSVPWWAWALLAVAIAFYAYGEHEYRRGKAEIRQQWDRALEDVRREVADLDRQNAAKEEAGRLQAETIGAKRETDQLAALAARDGVIRDLRAGNLRLRQQWQGCVSGAQAGDPAGLPGGLVPADDLRATGAGDLVRAADDADSRVKRLVEFQNVLRAACPNAGG